MSEKLYHSPMQSFIDMIKMIAAALIIVAIMRTFIIQPYVIPTGSMLETLQIGDRLFVTKFSYGIHLPYVEKELFSTGEPEHGDIIVFPFPEDTSQNYIKRVIGLPGDRLEIRNKQLYRNGEAIDEPYVNFSRGPNAEGANMPQIFVPQGKVFVMGDNRDNSRDSRFWGFVDKDTIYGKAWMIYWSSTDFINVKWDRIGTMLR